MSLFEADLRYISIIPLDIQAKSRVHQLPRGYYEINFPNSILEILRELKSSLMATQE
jgi:hypothetical protein